MTDVAADLATLRRSAHRRHKTEADQLHPALDRVEAELARMRYDLGEADRMLAGCEKEVARLTQERDEAQQDRNEYIDIAERESARAKDAEAEVARLRDGLRDLMHFMGRRWFDGLPVDLQDRLRALAEGGVASENVCPCGHHADQHPAVWSIAGDATTRCQAEGCHCLDYDGPGLDAPEDGAAQPLPRSEYGGYMGGEPWGPDHPSYDEMGQ